MLVQDTARLAATDAYMAAWRRLIAEAKAAEASGRPIYAKRLRFQASLVARATLAEELDAKPRDLP